MRVKILTESGRAGHVYWHYTNANGIIGILKDNVLKSREQSEHMMSGKNTASLTRDKNFGKRFNDVSMCRMAINAEKLAHNHKIKPYEWNNYSFSSDTARSTQESESEEAVLGNIENIKDYILSIDVVDTVYNNDDSVIFKNNQTTPRQSFVDTLKSGKVKGISATSFQIKHNIKTYDKFLDFIRQNNIPVGTFGIASDTYAKNENKKKYGIDPENSNVKDHKVFIVGEDYDSETYCLVPTLSEEQALKKFRDAMKVGKSVIVSTHGSNLGNFLDLKGIDDKNCLTSLYQLIRNNPSRIKNKSLNAKFKIILNNKVQELKNIINIDKANKMIAIKA